MKNLMPGTAVIVSNSQGCFLGFIQGITSAGGYWVATLDGREVYCSAEQVQAL